jgi:shikimate dehydrogenase
MTRRVGVIGWPAAHSRSPQMHNAAFAALGLDWRYGLLRTPPDQLQVVVNRIRSGELTGANVTIPHKSAVMPWLDEIDATAQAIGAVNTIVIRDGRLIGYNTDAAGFSRALSETGVEVKGRACAVLGAGGAARAVVYALKGLGARVTIYARDVSRARALIGPDEQARSLAEVDRMARETVLVVNATPVGMAPAIEASPWPDGAPFPPGALAFDLITHPRRTRWLEQAERSGARTTNGLAMLVYQGAAAFEMWTGCAAPIDAMRAAVESASPPGPLS